MSPITFQRRLAASVVLAASLLTACASEPSEAPAEDATAPSTSVVSEAIEALAIPNLSQPVEGLLCAGQLTPEQMDGLKAAGFQSFVSLREATEKGAGWEEAHAAEHGIEFQRLPVAGAAGVNEAAARELAGALESASGPTVLYCGSSNRVGALLALKAFHLESMPAEEALLLGKSAGVVSLEPLLREQLGL